MKIQENMDYPSQERYVEIGNPTTKKSLKWWNLKFSLNNGPIEPGVIYSSLSNSKQKTGPLTNRDWWKYYVRGGLMFWTFNESKMEFFIEVDSRITELDISTRFRKTMKGGNLCEILEVPYPVIHEKLCRVKTFGTFTDRIIEEISI